MTQMLQSQDLCCQYFSNYWGKVNKIMAKAKMFKYTLQAKQCNINLSQIIEIIRMSQEETIN